MSGPCLLWRALLVGLVAVLAVSAIGDMLVLEVLLPILVAPLVAGEQWTRTPGSGVVLLGSVSVVLAGATRIATTGGMQPVVTGTPPS